MFSNQYARRVLTAGMAFVSSAAWSAQSRPNGAVDAVKRLYQDYAWVAVIDDPTPDKLELFQQSGKVLEKYFDKSLVALILRDRRCVIESHGVCRLDFLPMWTGQDPQAAELKVLPTKDPTLVSVTFVYPGDHSRIELSYPLLNTSNGWKIKDIQRVGADAWSLKKILESKRP